jgi:hypothetical protein
MVFGPDRMISPTMMAQLVRNWCPDRPTVLVVSACYSGIFVDGLAAPNRMILTAARGTGPRSDAARTRPIRISTAASSRPADGVRLHRPGQRHPRLRQTTRTGRGPDAGVRAPGLDRGEHAIPGADAEVHAAGSAGRAARDGCGYSGSSHRLRPGWVRTGSSPRRGPRSLRQSRPSCPDYRDHPTGSHGRRPDRPSSRGWSCLGTGRRPWRSRC